jgi:hypothetical protein
MKEIKNREVPMRSELDMFFNGTHYNGRSEMTIQDIENALLERVSKFKVGDKVRLNENGLKHFNQGQLFGSVVKKRKDNPWLRVETNTKGTGNYEPDLWEIYD